MVPHPKKDTPGFPPGFTLVELTIVVVLIGILAGIAVPSIALVRENTQASVIARELQVYQEAFNRFDLHNGNRPSGVFGWSFVSPEMQPYLQGTGFDRVGEYGQIYYYLGSPIYVSGEKIDTSIILFKQVSEWGIGPYSGADLNVIRRVDAIIDDGNLSTGELILFVNAYPLLKLSSGGN